MYLLDTNVISELRKGTKADSRVKAWAEQVDMQFMHISVVSILEIRLGILSIQRKDTAQAGILNSWLSRQVIPAFAGRIIPVDIDVALRCAELHVPDPRSDREALIAATALVHRLTVVTRDTKDFQPTGVRTLNPWL
ncbi:MAG: type II toxin-antitoxin system VapC family toxin [Desulfovibrionaceae bacterium]|nr:type II toxin-antitoxin system VapC family toxin [Desulfovibrionaceae bacterium]